MGYSPNTTIWKRGDIVIHAADAKKDYMLMQVAGYSRDGFCKARYLHPGHFENMKKTIMKLQPKDLHDPADFGIQYN